MKKTENKRLMMILGTIVCWITGAVICGLGYVLYKYFTFKIIMYIVVPFSIGFFVYSIIYKRRQEK